MLFDWWTAEGIVKARKLGVVHERDNGLALQSDSYAQHRLWQGWPITGLPDLRASWASQPVHGVHIGGYKRYSRVTINGKRKQDNTLLLLTKGCLGITW
jgi:hypothetical protein